MGLIAIVGQTLARMEEAASLLQQREQQEASTPDHTACTGDYIRVTSGTCADNNAVPVMTMGECDEHSRQFMTAGGNQHVSLNPEGHSADKPIGCTITPHENG